MTYWIIRREFESGGHVFIGGGRRDARRFASRNQVYDYLANECWNSASLGIVRNVVVRVKANVVKARTLSPDERRVLAYIKKRLLQGQKTYGPLDLATAKKDWKQERVDEIADLLIYSAFEALKNDLPKDPSKDPCLSGRRTTPRAS